MKSVFMEAFCLAVVAFVTLSVCLAFAKVDTVPLDTPYQATLSHIYPAIFFAAGYGLVTTDVDKIPGLADFIYRKADHFDISAIPSDFPKKKLSAPAATTHLYYLYTIGWIWWLFGVSVDALVKYTIFLRILCALLTYGIFRLGLSRISALVAVLMVCTSPAMVNMDISPRDMGKVPFILAFLLIAAWLVLDSHRPRKMLAMSMALGVLLGIGFGFRQDLLVCLPPAFMVTLFLAKVESAWPWAWRLAGTVIMTIVFLVLSRPIFNASAMEGNQQTSVHTFLVGMSEKIERNLLSNGQSYNLLPDSFSGEAASYAIVNTYARRLGNQDSMVNPHCAEYERHMGERNAQLLIDPYFFYNGKAYAEAGRLLMRDLFWNFPADFIVRAWCASVSVFKTEKYYVSLFKDAKDPRPEWMERWLSFRAAFATHIARCGLGYLVLALTVLAGYRFRTALIGLLFLLYFSGYPSLQFEYRHSFYLVFIPVMALAMCVEYPVRWLKAGMTVSSHPLSRNVAAGISKAALFIVLVLALYVIPLSGFRVFQTIQLIRLAGMIDSAPKEKVALLTENHGVNLFVRPEISLKGLENAANLPPGETAWDYIALSFDTYGCDIPLKIHYDETRMLNNFSQEITIRGCKDGRSGRVTLYCPVYEVDTTYSVEMLREFLSTFPSFAAMIQDSRPLEQQNWWRRSKFLGISVPKEYIGLFVGFERVTDIHSARLLPIMQVPEDRKFLQPYKRAPWEDYLVESFTGCGYQCPDSSEPLLLNDVWELDEKLVYHPPSKVFSRLLLPYSPVEAYIAEWRSRVEHMSALSEAAALDLANAATVWLNRQDPESALTACTEACRLNPDDPLYRVRAGQILELIGKKEDAITQYEHALSVQPFLPDTADRVDGLLIALRSPVERLDLWKRVFDRHPDNWFAGMRLGTYYEEEQRYAEASAAYGKVNEFHPSHPDTRLALARCLGKSGNPGRALTLLESLVNEHSDYGKLVLFHAESIGEHLSLQGDLASALAFFAFLTTLEPESPARWMRLGDEQVKCGQANEGQESFKKALKLALESQSPLKSLIEERIL